eukprot:m.42864 g.42864  ORF g.42864 m.42864 type:complete len:56 (+) comp10741_c0_seq3:3703-3870(+)
MLSPDVLSSTCFFNAKTGRVRQFHNVRVAHQDSDVCVLIVYVHTQKSKERVCAYM